MYRSCNKDKCLIIDVEINTSVTYTYVSGVIIECAILFILPKCAKTREPEDEQLCKLSAPYKEI